MKPSMIGQLTKQSINQLERDFAILTLDQKKKNQILKSALKRVKQEANKNKAKQQSPDGTPWKPRQKEKNTKTKKGKQKPKKMLAKILNKSTISVNGDIGMLWFKSKRRSEVAGRHNYGGEVPKKSVELDKEDILKLVEKSDKATEEQAKRLLELGFSEPAKKHPIHRKRELSWATRKKVNKIWLFRMMKGVNRKPSSVSYICQNLTQSQAGVLIAELKKYHGVDRKDKDTIVTPARPFLNEDEAHNAKILTEEINKVINLGA